MTAQEKIQKYDQAQLLSFVDELSPEESEAFEKQIEKIDFSVLEHLTNRNEEIKKGDLSPLAAMELAEIDKNRDRFENIGLEAIRKGRVGAVLLAGGMGTRLGSDDPKGMYNIGVTKDLYIFQCLINNLTDVVRKAGKFIHLFVMTSDLNYEKTTAFFENMNYFGYPKEYITFFKQEMAPTCDYNGKIFLEEPGKVSVSPNGNGGWFLSMMKSGILDKIKSNKIEFLNVFAVDNVLQRICDPVFIGATVSEGRAVGAKVVKKNDPDERVGVICLEDGKPSIVEYYELTDELRLACDERGERLYNFGVILNYLFKVDDLENIVKYSLPYHVVEKKITHIDEDGNIVKPDKPNGYKFEQLVLDMIHLAKDCLPFEVVREKEFAPIKNKEGIDSVESARVLLQMNGVEI